MEVVIAIATVIKVISEIVVPCAKQFAGNGKTERRLHAVQQELEELNAKHHATLLKLHLTERKVSTLSGVIVVLFPTAFFCVVFPDWARLVGAIGVSFVLGGLLLPEVHRLRQHASEGLRRTASLWRSENEKMRAAVLRHTGQLRGRIRDWKWKSIPVARIFRTTP